MLLLNVIDEPPPTVIVPNVKGPLPDRFTVTLTPPPRVMLPSWAALDAEQVTVHGLLVELVLQAAGKVPDLLLELKVTLPPVELTDGALGAATGGNGELKRATAAVTALLPASGSAVVVLLKLGEPPLEVF